MRGTVAALAVLAALAVAVPAAATARVRLGWNEAKQEAVYHGDNLPVPGGNAGAKTSWCSRWSAIQIDCGVEADGSKSTSTYDSCKTLDYDYNCLGGYDYSTEATWCMATVDVFKATRNSRWHYRGDVYSRLEDDQSCYGG
jgi:hypothetical protein